MVQLLASQQPPGFKNHVENIIIVGAGGTMGRSIIKSLATMAVHRITAITRPDSKNELPSGLHAVKKAAYDDHGSLVEAMKGQDVLIITMSREAPQDTQAKLIDAAVEAGVKYVMPNEYGTDQESKSLSWESHLATRRYVEKVGKDKTSWIGLCSGLWYEYSLVGNPFAGGKDRYGFDFGKKAVVFFDDGNTKTCTSMLSLCGDAVANVFALPILPKDEADKSTTLSQFANSSLYISSFTVSQRDMFDSILRVTGDKESDWKITYENSSDREKRGQEMRDSGNIVGAVIALYSKVMHPGAGGDFSSKVMNGQLGLPEGDLDSETRTALRMREEGALGP